MLMLGIYSGKNGSLLGDYSARAVGARFGSNKHGFAGCSFFVPMALAESFQLYDRPGTPWVYVNWNGLSVWEGRVEDVAIEDAGVTVTALGAWRYFMDTYYTASHPSTTAQAIAQALVAAVSAVNSTLSSNTALIQDPGVTISEYYTDKRPAEILDRLCVLGDSTTPPRVWEACVWEDAMLVFRPRASAGRTWYVDAVTVQINRTLESLNNKVTVRYDGGGAPALTSAASDTASIAQAVLTREAIVDVQTIDATLAGVTRDAYLDAHKDPTPAAQMGFARIYDATGAQYPLWVVRAGDTLVARNLPLTLSTAVDKIRSFVVSEVTYDVDANALSVVPENNLPTIDVLIARYKEYASEVQPANYGIVTPLHAPFLSLLPELRGLWMASNVNESGNLLDLTGQGRTLTNNASTPRAVYNNIVPYCDLNGSTQYFSRADEAGLDITGALTIGGWFWLDTIAADTALVGKQTPTGNQRGYILNALNTTAYAQMLVSVDGVNNTTVASTTGQGVSRWCFVAGRFTPSTELAVFVNTIKAVNTTSIPASIFNNTAPLTIGSRAPGQWLDGRFAIAFLCSAVASDQALATIFQQTRGYFGV